MGDASLLKHWGLRKKAHHLRGGGRDSIESSLQAFPASLVKEVKAEIGLAYQSLLDALRHHNV